MCIRNTYFCTECKSTFAIPKKHYTDTQWYKWIAIWSICYEPNDKLPLHDTLCSNTLCLRRTEEGYRSCLGIQDECYFCIRYGPLGVCYNKHIYVPCRSCYYANWANYPDSKPYDVPLHYRCSSS